jgi:hypothetical protein
LCNCPRRFAVSTCSLTSEHVSVPLTEPLQVTERRGFTAASAFKSVRFYTVLDPRLVFRKRHHDMNPACRRTTKKETDETLGQARFSWSPRHRSRRFSGNGPSPSPRMGLRRDSVLRRRSVTWDTTSWCRPCYFSHERPPSCVSLGKGVEFAPYKRR